MSAVSAPFGFILAKHPSGQSRANEYTIASAYGTNLFLGDPVKLVTAGTIQLGTSDGTRTGTVADVALLGVFAGCVYTDASGKPTWSAHWPANTVATDIKAYVYDDPENVYLVQADDAVSAAAIGDQANLAGFAAPGGSTITGRSTASLDATLLGAGDQAQFRIVDFDRSQGNAPGDAYTKVLVQIAQHQFRAAVNAI